jgi:glycosyltransferase involved in cell wall biosynthesis
LPTVAPSKYEMPSGGQPHARPRVAVLANSFPPYRVYLHEQIVAQVPEVELWSLSTHSNAYQRWSGLRAPPSIRPVDFGHGEPTNEQTEFRYALREWRKAGEIIRWLRDHEIDVVFCQGCGDVGRMRVIRWCKRRGIACFLTGDFNIRTDNHGPVKHWIKRQVYQRAVRWCTGLMPCGELGLELLHRYGGRGKPAAMFPFVPDVELFENTPREIVERVRRRFDLRPDRRRIVFSARFMPVKRPDLALRAFAAIADERPEWDLVMLGDGVLRRELEASVPDRLHARITWTGFLDYASDVAGFYAASDVLLLPSDHEPWGVVVAEAAAAGLAIVASGVVGASPELVREGRNGALFPAGDLPSLTQALLEITAPERIDDARLESRGVLREWLAANDPLAGFRWALAQCGVLLECEAKPLQEQAHWIGTAGGAAVPV